VLFSTFDIEDGIPFMQNILPARLADFVTNILIIIILIIIIASHEDEMKDKYNDKLCTSIEVIQ